MPTSNRGNGIGARPTDFDKAFAHLCIRFNVRAAYIIYHTDPFTKATQVVVGGDDTAAIFTERLVAIAHKEMSKS
jgi:hypothetical protein